MAGKKNSPKPKMETFIDSYMSYVLENESGPKSIYKFCKDHNLREQDFYEHFGSLEGLKRAIWNALYDATMDLLHKNKEFESFSNRDKMLTFFFSFFELLALNRSYLLMALSEHRNNLKNLDQLKGLRSRFKEFASALIEDGNTSKNLKITQRNPQFFSEAAWLQFLFLLKFWVDDPSAGFEKTDIAIEKSVNTAFDLFENSPLERILDFGKFLYKESMA